MNVWGCFVVLLLLGSEFVTVPSMANSHLRVVGVSVGRSAAGTGVPGLVAVACSGWEDAAAIICK